MLDSSDNESLLKKNKVWISETTIDSRIEARLYDWWQILKMINSKDDIRVSERHQIPGATTDSKIYDRFQEQRKILGMTMDSRNENRIQE